ncbi:MAG: hypothetical protein JXR86_02725 [Spirochaetales bacterium]|nr:hypothetical protein [Spirochaetales bacterium]
MKPVGPSPSDIRKKLKDKWEKGIYLSMKENDFPLTVPLGRINSRTMTERFDDVRSWINLFLENEPMAPYLQWEEINHRLFGKNRIPVRLVFPGREGLARFLGRRQLEEWDDFKGALEKLYNADMQLGLWGEDHPLEILKEGEDLDRLLFLWKWMSGQRRPGIYLRQIDLEGIDSKFTEKHKKILSQWLDLTLPEEAVSEEYRGVSRFEERYGYLKKPELIRFRLLYKSEEWKGCSDISLPADEFCRLYSDEEISFRTVIVVENDICALSFPSVERGMVIFGRGYNFESLRNCRWLDKVRLFYWGDLDTHGFAILDQFRALFPHTTSLLMDRETLMNHKVSWGEEPKQFTGDLNHLTGEENRLFEDFKFNRIAQNLRLEQEFIRYGLIKIK